MNAFAESNLLHAVGWSLVHFVWQGCLIALFAWLLFGLLARQTANVRYLIGCVALVAMVLCPVATTIWIASNSTGKTVVVSSDFDMINLRSTGDEVDSAFFGTADSPVRSREISGSVVGPVGDDSDTKELAQANAAQGTVEHSVNPNHEAVTSIPVQILRERISLIIGPVIPVVALVWSAGVCLLSMKLLLGWFRIRSLQRFGEPIQDSSVVAMFEGLKSRLQVNASVQLRETVAVCSPMVVGWLRPVILIPLVAMTGLNQRELAAVLAHELAHIRRADYLVNLLQSIIETLLFYHPAVWWLSRRVREERENGCDDLAIAVCDDRRTLVEALLKLEQARQQSPPLAMASDGGDLVKRVARLLNPGQSQARSHFAPLANWVSAAVAVGLVGILLLFSLPNPVAIANHASDSETFLQDADDKAQNQDGKTEQERDKISIRVIDPDGQPISSARLRLSVRHQETPNTLTFETDQDGLAQLPLPEGLQRFRLWAFADGYAGLLAAWEEGEIKQGVLPPNDFTFQMIPSVEVGGLFVDEAGNPVENVEVEVRYDGGGEIPEGRIRFDTRSKLISDGDGRWSLANIPPGDNVRLRLKVIHPDFISDQRWGESQDAHRISLTELRDQTAKIVLKQGVAIRGTVTNETGNPIPQALIVWGDDPYGQAGSQEIFAEQDGSFQTPTQRPGDLRVTVIAQGYAPDSRIVTVSPDMPEEDFVLEPGKKLEIHFVDPDGQPVTDVYVGIEEWRRVQSLYNHVHPNVLPTGIPRRCNADGVYVWDWAPEDAVTYKFASRDFHNQEKVKLTAQDQPITVVLKRPTSISGTVTDLDGHPVKNFSVIPIHIRNSSNRRRKAIQGSDGLFSFNLDAPDGTYQLLIEADGFLESTTELFNRNDPKKFEIRLEPSMPIQYQVVDQNGEPVSQARIIVAPTDQKVNQMLFLNGRHELDLEYARNLISDENGHFFLQPSLVLRTIMAVTADGYGEVGDKPESPATTIQLNKWATIQGTVTRKGKPWQVAWHAWAIRYLSNKSWHLQQIVHSRTDADGSFQGSLIAGVPTTISFSDSDPSRLTRYHLAVFPVTDEIFQLDFSGATRFSTKIRFEGENRDKVDFANSIVKLRGIEPAIELPADLLAEIEASGLSSKDPQAVFDWFTDQEDRHLTRCFRECLDTYEGRLSEGSLFTTDILRPGKYELSVQATAKSGNHRVISGSLSDFRQVVEIGPEPVDFGEIVVPLFDNPEVGSEVGDFGFKNLSDQAELSLAQFRGSYVLLDFWAPGCDVCEADTPKVHRLAKMVAAKGKTTIISLMANGSGTNVRMPSEIPSGLTWIDGQVAVSDPRHLWKRLGVWTSQHFVLIDPEGNYVAGGNLVQIAAKLESLRLK